MKNCVLVIIFLVISHMIFAQNLKLIVKIEGLENSKGKFLAGIYNNGQKFPDKKYALAGKILSIHNKNASISFDNLKPGKYAVAIIHDEDKDGELSTNFLGIPKEGFGFSNNVIGIMGPPSFEKAAVLLNKNLLITIKLRY